MVSAEREPIWNLYMNLNEIGSLPPKSVELAVTAPRLVFHCYYTAKSLAMLAMRFVLQPFF